MPVTRPIIRASPLDSISARREAAQAPAVGVADGAGERVGGIRGGRAGELQQPLHHVLHLFLAGVAVADHRLLHLQRGVFRDWQARVDRGADRRAARLAERERRRGIDVDEDFLDGDLLRPVFADHLAQVLEDRSQAPGKVCTAGFDAAARDVNNVRAVLFDDPEPGDAQTRVDAKYPQGWTGHCPALYVRLRGPQRGDMTNAQAAFDYVLQL